MYGCARDVRNADACREASDMRVVIDAETGDQAQRDAVERPLEIERADLAADFGAVAHAESDHRADESEQAGGCADGRVRGEIGT